MSTPSLSHTLVAGTPENVNHVQDMFQDLVDHLSSAFVDDSNVAVGAGIDGAKLLAESVGTEELEDGAVTGPKQGVVPHLRVYASGTPQSIANNTLTTVLFNQERWDSGTDVEQHSTSVNSGYMVCKEAGLYSVGANIAFANATGLKFVGLRYNLGLYVASTAFVEAGATGADANVQTQYRMEVGDTMDVVVLQASGGAVDLVVALNRSPEAWWAKISA